MKMEKVNLTVSVDQEVVNALTIFLRKTGGGSVQKELEKRMSEMYAEVVPESVREYIGLRYHTAGTKPHPGKIAAKAGTVPQPKPPQEFQAHASGSMEENEHAG